MSTAGIHQLQLDIQHALITANQLLHQITTEIRAIKDFTRTGGQLENIVELSGSYIAALADTYQVDLNNIPPARRQLPSNETLTNQNQDTTQR